MIIDDDSNKLRVNANGSILVSRSQPNGYHYSTAMSGAFAPSNSLNDNNEQSSDGSFAFFAMYAGVNTTITSLSLGFRSTAGTVSASFTSTITRVTGWLYAANSENIHNLNSIYSNQNRLSRNALYSAASSSLCVRLYYFTPATFDPHPLATTIFTHPGSIKTLSNFSFIGQDGSSGKPGGAEGGYSSLFNALYLTAGQGIAVHINGSQLVTSGTDAMTGTVNISWIEDR